MKLALSPDWLIDWLTNRRNVNVRCRRLHVCIRGNKTRADTEVWTGAWGHTGFMVNFKSLRRFVNIQVEVKDSGNTLNLSVREMETQKCWFQNKRSDGTWRRSNETTWTDSWSRLEVSRLRSLPSREKEISHSNLVFHSGSVEGGGCVCVTNDAVGDYSSAAAEWSMLVPEWTPTAYPVSSENVSISERDVSTPAKCTFYPPSLSVWRLWWCSCRTILLFWFLNFISERRGFYWAWHDMFSRIKGLPVDVICISLFTQEVTGPVRLFTSAMFPNTCCDGDVKLSVDLFWSNSTLVCSIYRWVSGSENSK